VLPYWRHLIRVKYFYRAALLAALNHNKSFYRTALLAALNHSKIFLSGCPKDSIYCPTRSIKSQEKISIALPYWRH